MARLRRHLSSVALAAAVLLAGAAAPAQAAGTGPETGLPLPRFVSIKSGEANLRTGPGQKYPIRWVYKRRFLPVRIVREFGNWRSVEDPWGEAGWLHRSLLSGRRTAMVMRDLAPLHREPDASSAIVLYAERRIIGTLEICQQGWCRLNIDGRAGWMPDGWLFGGDGTEDKQ
jgi:SH3-like domain-containing protein